MKDDHPSDRSTPDQVPDGPIPDEELQEDRPDLAALADHLAVLEEEVRDLIEISTRWQRGTHHLEDQLKLLIGDDAPPVTDPVLPASSEISGTPIQGEGSAVPLVDQAEVGEATANAATHERIDQPMPESAVPELPQETESGDTGVRGLWDRLRRWGGRPAQLPRR